MNWKNIIKKSLNAYLECSPTPISVNGVIYADGDCGNSWLVISPKKKSLIIEGLKKGYLIFNDGEIVSNFSLKTQSYEKSIAFHSKMKELLEESGLIVELCAFID